LGFSKTCNDVSWYFEKSMQVPRLISSKQRASKSNVLLSKEDDRVSSHT